MSPRISPHNLRLEPHREAVHLRAEIERLREKLAKFISDHDFLTASTLPAIEAEYNMKIGGLEYEAFRLECDVRRARRRLELAQSHLNRGAYIPFELIERELESEFSRWQAKIEEMRRAIEAARAHNLAPCLSATETRELQTLYRRLAKRLHPDLNPRQSDRDRNLWLQVTDAYRDSALEELRTLALLLDDAPAADMNDAEDASILDTLRRRQSALRAQINRALARLAEIKTTPPYTLLEKLDDAAWLATRTAELHKQIASLKEHRDRLAHAFQTLTGVPAPCAASLDEEWAEFIGDAE